MQKLACSCCGGKLMMQEDGIAVCQSCGMEYASGTVKKMIVEMKGSVQVEGINSADSIFRRAEVFLSMDNLASAEENYTKLTQLYPDDYRGWWGLARTLDWDKFFWENAEKETEMPVVYRRALQFAPADKKSEIQAYYEKKAKSIGSRAQASYAKMKQETKSIYAQIQKYKSQLQEISALHSQEQRKWNALANRGYVSNTDTYTFFLSLFILAAAIAAAIFFPVPAVQIILLAAILFFCRVLYVRIQAIRYHRLGNKILRLGQKSSHLCKEIAKLERQLEQIQRAKN